MLQGPGTRDKLEGNIRCKAKAKRLIFFDELRRPTQKLGSKLMPEGPAGLIPSFSSYDFQRAQDLHRRIKRL